MMRVPKTDTSNFKGDDTANLREGMEVEHGRFGRGTVVSIEVAGNRKAVVDFEEHGKKQLLLKFAKLKILN
jgi:DNA helicase-2/ATP-dependent DNA helicase PcrA